MISKKSLSFLSILIFSLVFLPGYLNQTQPRETPHLFDKHMIVGLILRYSPALILLFLVIRDESKEEQRQRGFVRPTLLDGALALFALCLTLGLGIIFAPSHAFYIVEKGNLWAFILVGSVMVALVEELYFRSWLLKTLPALGWSPWVSALFSIILFSLGHFWEGFSGFLFALLSATIYTLWFLRRPCFIAQCFAHTAHNVLAFILANHR